LRSSPSIIRLITSRRVRWAGHVARMERERERERGGGSMKDAGGKIRSKETTKKRGA
jgi:hypothetical protein